MKKIIKLYAAFLISIFLSFSCSKIIVNNSSNSENSLEVLKHDSKQDIPNQEDPDLKLSIEELRKKYPISLLDKKKKNYKQGDQINIDDYSIEEIKAAFLNADRNFISRIKVPEIASGKLNGNILDNNIKVHSQLELDIIEESCQRLGYAIIDEPKKHRILQHFLFSSDKIQIFFLRFVPIKTNNCFIEADPFETEDRN